VAVAAVLAVVHLPASFLLAVASAVVLAVVAALRPGNFPLI